jgi:parvulin-like peptidyl-prolyl isomerase
VLIAYKGAKGAPKEVTRSKADAKTLAEKVRKEALAAGANFSDLAQKYSDDAGSKDNQGSLGKFKPESKVKPFADAAFALRVDQISDVVETPFGFHVIKRTQ